MTGCGLLRHVERVTQVREILGYPSYRTPRGGTAVGRIGFWLSLLPWAVFVLNIGVG